MLYDDQPISRDEEDKLGRLPFVDEIFELIDKYTEAAEKKEDHAGLVIGLEGAWGDGKTSVLNLLEHRFRDNSNQYVVQRLDSWLAMDRVTLAVEFFKALRTAAVDMGPFLDGADYVKDYVGKILRGVGTLAANTGVSVSLPFLSVKPDWKRILNEKSLRQEKDDMEEKLAQSPRYIIYMIDDIDRLNSEEIATLMQLVKNIADFPKIIYLLAYDRDIVTEALQRIDGKNGREFMEKIVQVPIRMPEMGKMKLLDYFCNGISNIASSLESNKTKAKFDTYQGGVVADEVYMRISPYLKSIRDCNRILNAFQVRYFICAKFCAADDLLCVVILEVFEPSVISYLVSHYEEFYPSVLPDSSSDSTSRVEEYRKKVQQAAQCTESSLAVLAHLFPAFAEKIGIPSSAQSDSSQAIIENKIARSENFSSYFILSPNEDEVYSTVIKELLLYGSEEKIAQQLKKWTEENKLAKAFSKVQAYCDIYARNIQLSQERWPPILRAMTSVQNISLDFNQRDLWTRIPWSVVLMMIDRPIFHHGSQDINLKTAGWIIDIFYDEHVSVETLDVLMWHIGAGYEWTGSSTFVDAPPEVDKQLFVACKKVFVKRLKDYVPMRGFLQSEMIKSLLPYQIKEDGAYLQQYLAKLTTIEQIFPWLNFALRKEKVDSFSDDSGYIWRHEDDLLVIMPASFSTIVERKLDEIPADWLKQEAWPIFVLYDAYVKQESWMGSKVRGASLKEYGDKVYHEKRRLQEEVAGSNVAARDL